MGGPVVAFALALLLLVVAALDLGFSLRGVGRSAALVTHTYRVIGQADGLLSSLTDAETGQRGFLLAGEDRYLGPYREGRAQALDRLDALRALVADDPRQAARLPPIETLVRDKLDELARTVALAEAGDEARAIAVLRSGEGKATMDRLRGEIAAFAAEEQRQLDDRRVDLERRERVGLLRALGLAGASALAAGLGAVLLLRRGRRVEAALAATAAESARRAALLRQTYDTTPVGLSYHDAALRHVAINERLAAINGRPVVAHLGRTTSEIAPEIGPAVEPILQRVLATGEPVVDVDIRTPAGPGATEPRDYLGSYWPAKDDAGAVVGVNVAILDVTDRKAAERELAEREALLRAIYDAVPVGLVTAEVPSGRITGANAYLEVVTGHPVILSPDVEGYRDWVSYHPDGRRVEPHEYPMARLIRDGLDAAEAEVLWDRRGERRWVRIAGRRIKAEDGTTLGAVVSMVDIDDLKRAGERLAREVAARTAELASANTQLEAFAYTVSHDLRAPLRGMEGFARILLEDFSDGLGAQGKRYAERIVAAAERMEGLIDDLLTFSRVQRVEVALRALDPTPVVRAAAQDARASAPDSLVEVEAPLPPVVAEPVILSHVLGNLLTNAVKFRQEGRPARVRVRAERREGQVRLWVEDDGIGIAAEDQGRIFNAFERLHGQEAYSGSGIGLAIVKAGVERMNGAVGVVSERDGGARFFVDLAAAPNRAAQPAVAAAGGRDKVICDGGAPDA